MKTEHPNIVEFEVYVITPSSPTLSCVWGVKSAAIRKLKLFLQRVVPIQLIGLRMPLDTGMHVVFAAPREIMLVMC